MGISRGRACVRARPVWISVRTLRWSESFVGVRRPALARGAFAGKRAQPSLRQRLTKAEKRCRAGDSWSPQDFAVVSEVHSRFSHALCCARETFFFCDLPRN